MYPMSWRMIPKPKQASRIGFKVEKGEKVRVFKKSGNVVKGGKK